MKLFGNKLANRVVAWNGGEEFHVRSVVGGLTVNGELLEFSDAHRMHPGMLVITGQPSSKS